MSTIMEHEIESLIKKQTNLISKGILITIFSFKDSKGENKFRAYFKDMNSEYLYNPMEKNEQTGKASFPIYCNVLIALDEMVKAAYQYIENK